MEGTWYILHCYLTRSELLVGPPPWLFPCTIAPFAAFYPQLAFHAAMEHVHGVWEQVWRYMIAFSKRDIALMW